MYEFKGEYERLRDYQRDCVVNIFDTFNSGANSAITVLPTAAGKTVILGAVIKRFLDNNIYKRAVVLSHLDILTLQNKESFKDFWKIKVGVLQARVMPEYYHRCIVSTMQSYRDEEKINKWGFKDRVGLCVIDETHMFGSDSYDRIVSSLPDDCIILGVTATPFRNNKDMTSMFDTTAYTISMQELIDRGALVRPILNHVQINKDESTESIHKKIVNIYYHKHSGQKSIVFLRTIDECIELERLFKSVNIKAKAVTSRFTGKKRYELIDDFKEGTGDSPDVLITVNVLTAGFSSDNVMSIFMPYRVRSVTSYIQRIGRGLRTDNKAGKTHCDIYVGGESPKLTKERYIKIQERALNAGRLADPIDDDRELPENEREYDDDGVRFDNKTLELSSELNRTGMNELSKMIRKEDFPDELLGNLVAVKKVNSKKLTALEPKIMESVFLRSNGIDPTNLNRLEAIYAVAGVLEKKGVERDRIYCTEGRYENVPFQAIPSLFKKNSTNSFKAKNRINKTLYSILDKL